MNPKTAQKAAECVVVRRKDGSFDVARALGGTYNVRIVDGATICNCMAGRSRRACPHTIAVRHTQKESQVVL